MRYRLLEVVSEQPEPKTVETYDDWEDVVDCHGTDMLFPLGDASPVWQSGGDHAQPAMLVVRLDKSHGYETVGVLVPATAEIVSVDESDQRGE